VVCVCGVCVCGVCVCVCGVCVCGVCVCRKVKKLKLNGQITTLYLE